MYRIRLFKHKLSVEVYEKIPYDKLDYYVTLFGVKNVGLVKVGD